MKVPQLPPKLKKIYWLLILLWVLFSVALFLARSFEIFSVVLHSISILIGVVMTIFAREIGQIWEVYLTIWSENSARFVKPVSKPLFYRIAGIVFIIVGVISLLR